MQIQNTNHVTIQGWMRTELGLKGNDLIVYAIIYGFSQTENQRFTGSLQYLADWCGATKQGIQKNLKNLIHQDLITKEQQLINGVTYVTYYAPKVHGIHLSFTNNISNTYSIEDKAIKKRLIEKEEINIIEKIGKDAKEEIKKNEDKIAAEAFRELYNEHCFNLPKARQLSEKRLKAIRSILQKYTIEEIIEVLNKANDSDFLTGNNDRGWTADIDFILREDKFLNILEGKYGGKKKKKSNDGLVLAPRATKEDRDEYKYHF